MSEDEWVGHVDLNKAERIAKAEERLASMLSTHRGGRPLLVRVDGRPGEMLVGFEEWQVFAIGLIGVRFYDTEQVEYFSPEQWATAKREVVG